MILYVIGLDAGAGLAYAVAAGQGFFLPSLVLRFGIFILPTAALAALAAWILRATRLGASTVALAVAFVGGVVLAAVPPFVFVGGFGGSGISAGGRGEPKMADIQDILTRMAGRKVLVSLDERLLARIDRAARRRGLSRSAYIAQLAAREPGTERGPGANRPVHAALRSLDRLFRRNPVPSDATAEIRGMRDER